MLAIENFPIATKQAARQISRERDGALAILPEIFRAFVSRARTRVRRDPRGVTTAARNYARESRGFSAAARISLWVAASLLFA